MIIVETDRLIIRQYTYKDIDKLHTILSNPITMSFWPAPFSLEQTENWIERSIENYAKQGFGRWAIIFKENNELIGDCGIMLIEIDGEIRHDLGYIIDYRYWHKGLATEAARECMDYGFKKLKINKLYANMAYNHAASMAVAERIGMKKEKEFYNQRNRNILTYLYSLKNPYINAD